MQKQDAHTAEVQSLRQISRDLVAISTLPYIWGGLSAEGIVKSLSEVLMNSLHLDLVYIRLVNAKENSLIERILGREYNDSHLLQIKNSLDAHLSLADENRPPVVCTPLEDAKLRVTLFKFGIGEDEGTIVLGSSRSNFPSEHDRVVVGVGANQAAVVIHRKHVEDALVLSKEKYQKLFDEMAQSNKHLSDFLAVLAHELRNPLAPILTGLEIMRMRPDSKEGVVRVRDMIERQTNHMVDLINDLLDISRVNSGKIELKKSHVDLHSIISRAVEASLPTIESARHELNVRIEEKPLWMNVDATRVTQIISNLLNNAAKYTPNGGKIKLSAEQDGEEVIISVHDNGLGIPSESLPLLFKMFSQVRNNLKHSQGGLGIGLALVHNLVALHQGTVSATSEGVGCGSTFIVRLPLDQTPHQALDKNERSLTEFISRPLRVVVADDNSDAAQSLADLLRTYGHDVHVADNGQKAFEIVTEVLAIPLYTSQ